MLTRLAAPAAIVAALVAFSLTPAAAQMTRGEITLEQAREILGANPVAIPGYPVRFYPLSGGGVLVRQKVDSGRLMAFREDRGGQPFFWGATSNESDAQRILVGEPSSAERRVQARQRYRAVGPVSVFYLGSSRDRIPHELLDRLAPIP